MITAGQRSAVIALLMVMVMMVPSIPAASDKDMSMSQVATTMTDIDTRTYVLEKDLVFTGPTLKDNMYLGTLDVSMDGLLNLDEPSMPSLPVEHVTIALPPNMVPLDVRVTTGDPVLIDLDRDITPGPMDAPDSCSAGPPGPDQMPELFVKGEVYQKDDLYPASNVRFSTSFGLTFTQPPDRGHILLSTDVRSQYVDIDFFPVLYNPVKGTLSYHDELHLEVTYTEDPDRRAMSSRADDYDMVIITPRGFADAFQVLADHHNDTGLVTTVVALDDIYSSKYFTVNGTDDPDRIKHFIWDAIENWGVSYVTLGGDHPEIPKRIAKIHWDFVTDLYYADIYKSGGVFADWNADGDAEFGEFTDDMNNIDIRPDVHLGRLPAKTVAQVSIMTEKVRYYDNNTAGADWFKQVTVLTVMTEGKDYGDHLADNIYKEDHGWSSIKLYSSEATAANFSAPQNHSVGVMAFWGHGGPTTWLGADTFTVADVNAMNNFQKLPIISIMACECGHYDHSSDCFAESFLKNPNGGAIAVLAGTRTSNANDMDSWAGATVKYFNEAYGQYHPARLGEMYSHGVDLFVENKNPRSNSLDYKNLVEYIFFGDPGASVGGYSQTTVTGSSDESERSGYPGETVTYNITVQNTGTGYGEFYFHTNLPDGSPAPAEWNVVLSSDHLALDPSGTGELQLNVTCPQDADANESLEVVVNMSSVNIPLSPMGIHTTTHVRTNYTFEFNLTENGTSIAPETEAQYQMTITNMGNDMFGFDLELADLASDWVYSFTEERVVLARGKSTNVKLTLEPGPNVTAGSYHMKVNCTLLGPADIFEERWVNTTVTQVHGFRMVANETYKEIDQGGSAKFNLSIENLGNHPDTVIFDILGGIGGLNIYLSHSSVHPKGFQVQYLWVSIHLPDTALAGNYTIVMEGTLFSDSSTQEVELTVHVLPIYEFNISADVPVIEGTAADTFSFELMIENLGNIEDTYDLSLTGLPEGWDIDMAGQVTVVPYGLTTVPIEIVPPEGDVRGGPYNMTLEAISEGSAALSSNLSLAIEIERIHGLELELSETRVDHYPGDLTSHAITIRNPGNYPNVYRMTTAQRTGWTLELEDDEVTVDAWNETTITLDITSSANATVGRYPFWIKAVSVLDDTIVDEMEISVNVDQVYGMALEPMGPTSFEVKNGGLVEFGYKLTNLGNGVDGFLITVPDLRTGWGLGIKSVVTVEAGAEHVGDVVITIPKDSKSGEFEITVLASSKGDPSVQGSFNVTIKVKRTETGRTGAALETSLLIAIIVVVAIVVVLAVVVGRRMLVGKGGSDIEPDPPVEGPTTPETDKMPEAPPTEEPPSSPSPPPGPEAEAPDTTGPEPGPEERADE